MYACTDERQNGALIEVGAALGAGKQVWLVTPHNWSWKHHPRVRVFDTLEKAVEAIMAAAAGERGPAGPHNHYLVRNMVQQIISGNFLFLFKA
jgi:hypothetical protein